MSRRKTHIDNYSEIGRIERAPVEGEEPHVCGSHDCERKRAQETFDDPDLWSRTLAARRIWVRCVECAVTKSIDCFDEGSLACRMCVKELGSDEATGRWDGKPEPSEDAKKGVA